MADAVWISKTETIKEFTMKYLEYYNIYIFMIQDTNPFDKILYKISSIVLEKIQNFIFKIWYNTVLQNTEKEFSWQQQ